MKKFIPLTKLDENKEYYIEVKIHYRDWSFPESNARKSKSFKLSDLPVEPPPNEPPVVKITTPQTNSTFQAGNTITFQATVTDPENETITDDNIIWHSNLNGELGRGKTFSVNNLVTSRHQISLVATDPQGLSGSDLIDITVKGSATNSIVKGTIYFIDDYPAQNTYVWLQRIGGSILDTFTDKNGSFIFPSVTTSGDCRLIIYASDNQTVVGNDPQQGTFYVGENTVVDRGRIVVDNSEYGRIIATLKETSTNDPIANANVFLLMEATANQVQAGCITNSDGLIYFPFIFYDSNYALKFQIDNVEVGRYPATGYFNAKSNRINNLGEISVNTSVENTAPTAFFTVSPTSGQVGTTFQFDASGCTDSEDPTSALQVRWDWENDGYWDTNYSTTKTKTHQYSTTGTKTIKLEVKDTGSLTNTTTKQITVTSQNTPPIASFTVSPSSGQVGTTFQVDASSCTDNEDPTSALQVRWDWENDGYWDTNYSTTKTKTHLYNSEGTKTIKLEVKDTGNLSDTTTRQVIIGNINYDEMVYVAAGSFEMGSNSGNSDEQPVHTVSLNAFYIDKYEVTNAKYATYLNEALAAGLIQASSSTVTKDGYELLDLNGSYCQISYSGSSFVVNSGKENYPVIEVTWYGADEFAKHYGKRLPTEAEWEYAARGGSQSQGYTYSGSNTAGDVAWYSGNSGSSTHPVGQKQANEIGTHDMSGNVWEWCNDWYGSNYYSSNPTNNPQGPSTGSYRVLRGGSWYDDTNSVRCAYRNNSEPHYSIYNFGFRCVR